MIYNKLLVKPFIQNIYPQNISEKIIINLLENCYKNCAFSTFPYIINKQNSIQAIQSSNSGNCISLSLYIKLELQKIKITSFLIPATIPNKYKLKGYLDISHVAIAIPKDKNTIFIVDPAFYFLNPIIINLQNKTCTTVFSKSIYDKEFNVKLNEYTTIDIIESCSRQLSKNLVLNKHQTIPNKTHYAYSYFKNDPTDSWCYYLTEIINPDEAITSFFINIKKYPFITTTFLDNNGVCSADYYIKISNHQIEISENCNYKKIILLNEIDENILESIDKKIKKFTKIPTKDIIKLLQ